MITILVSDMILANLCISDAELLIPLHINMINPVSATANRNRVLISRCRNALDGGNRAFADFHVTPPFGSSIVDTG